MRSPRKLKNKSREIRRIATVKNAVNSGNTFQTIWATVNLLIIISQIQLKNAENDKRN